MNEPAILGNSQQDSDVLCYRENVAYYTGNLVDDEGDNIVDNEGNNLIFEYVD